MKQTLRTQARGARMNLSEEERLLKSNQIVDQLVGLLEGKQTIGIYIAMKEEVDVTSLLFLYSSLAVPKIRNNEEMDFFLIHDASELEMNEFANGRLQLLEPTSTIWVAPNDLDVIIVPVVAFDAKRNRIGQGKGYYDRYLKHSHALRIGVAFEAQKVAECPMEEHDCKLDYIVTETTIY
ncbi:MAG: 5-formyltetrahydrofolate cyclo-ligase [Erysipelotrichia bacterium]|nr:5-formyltetrahydrofolate cyclo-ligase [Erysipelotrichia bacterium]NCC53891.1 5-formyltetrahydrofolate cyclo-ligase [Erysipelotrichia bacterium]